VNQPATIWAPSATKIFTSMATWQPAFSSANRMVVGFNPIFFAFNPQPPPIVGPDTGWFPAVFDDPWGASTTPDYFLADYHSQAIGAAYDDQDNLYVADLNRGRVLVYQKLPLLYDDFSGAALNTTLWGTAMSTGSTIVQSGGMLTVTIPAAANRWADLFSVKSFGLGTTFEARVNLSAGQLYDHKGIGYANARVGSDCSQGETEAAMWRGQDASRELEAKTSGAWTCGATGGSYVAGWRTIKVVRRLHRPSLLRGRYLLGTRTTNLPSGDVPIRFSGWTFTSPPGAPITIQIDWVRVMKN
jgi:hypothetical protein